MADDFQLPGAVLKDLRGTKGQSQAVFGDLVGWGQYTQRRFENGQKFTVDDLKTLVRAGVIEEGDEFHQRFMAAIRAQWETNKPATVSPIPSPPGYSQELEGTWEFFKYAIKIFFIVATRWQLLVFYALLFYTVFILPIVARYLRYELLCFIYFPVVFGSYIVTGLYSILLWYRAVGFLEQASPGLARDKWLSQVLVLLGAIVIIWVLAGYAGRLGAEIEAINRYYLLREGTPP